MKRLLFSIIAVVLTVFLMACDRTSKPEITNPVAFYYHNDLNKKEDFNRLFVAETRDGDLYQDDLIALMNYYFAGPEADHLVNPFPADLMVYTLEQSGTTVNIILSKEITQLSGSDLTMACTCLSLTLFDMLPCDSVQISADDGTLSGQSSIVITRDSLILTDDTPLTSEG